MIDPVPFLDLGHGVDHLRPELDAAWHDLLASRQFVGGPVVDSFESAWAAYCGTDHAVGVANGTDALQLTLRALGVGPGDEVIVPANTFIATAGAVRLVGAQPRFADVDDETLLLTVDTMARALTKRTRAVIVVHLYGHLPDMDALGAAARAAGVFLIEDAAQAHGARWQGRRAGSFGHAGCFSFYPGKNLGGFGDAGAVVTSDPDLAARLRVLRDHGRALGSHHDHVEVGTNSRLDPIQAAVLSVKLPRLDAWNAARARIVERYREAFAEQPFELVGSLEGSTPAHHLAVVRVRERDALRRRLDDLGIATGLHYPVPCHRQPGYVDAAGPSLPVVERAATEILSLPLFPGMTDEQIERVAAAVIVSLRDRDLLHA